MIRIDRITGGRFGNRILHYNNLVQLGDLLDVDVSCVSWEGNSFFRDVVSDKPYLSRGIRNLTWSDFERMSGNINGILPTIDYEIDPCCIHNIFHIVTKKDPREFLQIKEEFKPAYLNKSKVNVGIHIRGDDIISADGNNGREIHSPEYYKNAIDVVESELNGNNTKPHVSGNVVYYICTDDVSFDTYIKTIDYLKEKKYTYVVGDLRNHFNDFALLSECDVLICSSSTFVITAGFLGKPNKKIIHSLDWIRKHFDESYVPWGNYTDEYHKTYWKMYDDFWLDLYNGTGSKYYKVWRFV